MVIPLVFYNNETLIIEAAKQTRQAPFET
jgi:hypothetical protein